MDHPTSPLLHFLANNLPKKAFKEKFGGNKVRLDDGVSTLTSNILAFPVVKSSVKTFKKATIICEKRMKMVGRPSATI